MGELAFAEITVPPCRRRRATQAMSDNPTKQKPLSQILREAGKKALGGGIPGALAMVVQVLALMWMRTTIKCASTALAPPHARAHHARCPPAPPTRAPSVLYCSPAATSTPRASPPSTP